MATNAAEPTRPISSADQRANSDVPPAGLFRQRLGDREDRGGAGGVVVGAVMNPAGVVLLGERVAVASPAQVVVVRADRTHGLSMAAPGVVAGR